MARWFTSDLHLGHANIIKFCQRPFLVDGMVDSDSVPLPDVDLMNSEIVRTINDLVGPEDELWVLGDVAMGKLDDTLPLIKQLSAGRKILVSGNHDRCHPSNGKRAERFVEIYSDKQRSGFDEVILTNTTLLLDDGAEVSVSHFPYSLSPQESRARRGATQDTDRFTQWRPVDDGRWLLCGHVHDAWRQQGRQVNVGIDAWGGRPVSEIEIMQLISTGPADRPRLAWGR